MKAFGFAATGPSPFGPRGVLAAPVTTGAGNVVVAAGNEHYPNPGRGWQKAAHVVLTPDEAIEYGEALVAAARREVVA
jgi:hypothetical protein